LLAQSLLSSDRVALEVTGSCWEVARILEPHVDRVVVVSPGAARAARARALAREKRDPRGCCSAACRASRHARTCSASRAPLAGQPRAPARGARVGQRQHALLRRARAQRDGAVSGPQAASGRPRAIPHARGVGAGEPARPGRVTRPRRSLRRPARYRSVGGCRPPRPSSHSVPRGPRTAARARPWRSPRACRRTSLRIVDSSGTRSHKAIRQKRRRCSESETSRTSVS